MNERGGTSVASLEDAAPVDKITTDDNAEIPSDLGLGGADSTAKVEAAPEANKEVEMTPKRRDEVCNNMASAACESCALVSNCPILMLKNARAEQEKKPDDEKSYLKDLLSDNEENIVVAGYKTKEPVNTTQDAKSKTPKPKPEIVQTETLESVVKAIKIEPPRPETLQPVAAASEVATLVASPEAASQDNPTKVVVAAKPNQLTDRQSQEKEAMIKTIEPNQSTTHSQPEINPSGGAEVVGYKSQPASRKISQDDRLALSVKPEVDKPSQSIVQVAVELTNLTETTTKASSNVVEIDRVDTGLSDEKAEPLGRPSGLEVVKDSPSDALVVEVLNDDGVGEIEQPPAVFRADDLRPVKSDAATLTQAEAALFKLDRGQSQTVLSEDSIATSHTKLAEIHQADEYQSDDFVESSIPIVGQLPNEEFDGGVVVELVENEPTGVLDMALAEQTTDDEVTDWPIESFKPTEQFIDLDRVAPQESAADIVTNTPPVAYETPYIVDSTPDVAPTLDIAVGRSADINHESQLNPGEVEKQNGSIESTGLAAPETLQADLSAGASELPVDLFEGIGVSVRRAENEVTESTLGIVSLHEPLNEDSNNSLDEDDREVVANRATISGSLSAINSPDEDEVKVDPPVVATPVAIGSGGLSAINSSDEDESKVDPLVVAYMLAVFIALKIKTASTMRAV